jgi:maltose O-acetyltransferase
VVILPNVHIGRGSIIGAGAVVTRSIPEFSIAAGVPAKIIGSRG